MFISYAQNFEDVMLNRVFADKKDGYYIDVGAQHPLYDSVTKAFYDRGWHGINLEPVKEYYELLNNERVRDLNLNIAVGETASELDFFELESTGLSTFNRETAERLAQEGNYKINTYQVPVVKLADIFQQHLSRQIDFLKIDVEGWEEKVILGNDWEHFRPTIILLEATLPNSPTRAETRINDILKDQDYQQVYFDGLNDYYLANESSELKRHFETPPNVFDKFISYHLSTARSHAKNLEEVLKSREEENASSKQQLADKEQELSQVHQILTGKEQELSQIHQILTGKEQNLIESHQILANKEQELIETCKILENKSQELIKTYQNLESKSQQLATSERDSHIFKNRLKDEKFEITRLRKILTQLQNIETKTSSNLNQRINQLQTQLTTTEQQLAKANELIAAMKTSKFWKIRSVWFGVKNTLGISSKE